MVSGCTLHDCDTVASSAAYDLFRIQAPGHCQCLGSVLAVMQCACELLIPAPVR